MDSEHKNGSVVPDVIEAFQTGDGKPAGESADDPNKKISSAAPTTGSEVPAKKDGETGADTKKPGEVDPNAVKKDGEQAQPDELAQDVDYYTKLTETGKAKPGTAKHGDEQVDDSETEITEEETAALAKGNLSVRLGKLAPEQLVTALATAGIEITPDDAKQIIHAQNFIGKQARRVERAKGAEAAVGEVVGLFEQSGDKMVLSVPKLLVKIGEEYGNDPQKVAGAFAESMKKLGLVPVTQARLEQLEAAATNGHGDGFDQAAVEATLLAEVAKECGKDITSLSLPEQYEWLDSNSQAFRMFHSRLTGKITDARFEAERKRGEIDGNKRQQQEANATLRRKLNERAAARKAEREKTIRKPQELAGDYDRFFETMKKADTARDTVPYVDLALEFAEGQRAIKLLPKVREQALAQGQAMVWDALGVPESERTTVKPKRPAGAKTQVETPLNPDLAELAEPVRQ